jgi:hypothetical protein
MCVSEQPGAGHAPIHRPARCQRLRDGVAPGAGQLRAHVAHDMEAAGFVVQHLGDVLADLAQVAAAGHASAAARRRVNDGSARQVCRQFAQPRACAVLALLARVLDGSAHSTDRGHPFQADRGQRSRRSRTPWVGCLSDGVDGRPSVRHQFGTLSAMSVEQGLPGCPRGALAAGGQPGAEGVFGTVVVCCGSLVHGGGGACDATPPRWARRGRSGTGLARPGCRQAWALARRSDSPFSARVCEPCSSRSMMASAMVGSLSH